jgi:hypothetical protein
LGRFLEQGSIQKPCPGFSILSGCLGLLFFFPLYVFQQNTLMLASCLLLEWLKEPLFSPKIQFSHHLFGKEFSIGNLKFFMHFPGASVASVYYTII